MNYKNVIKMMILSSLSLPLAHAQHDSVGHGGNAVVCFAGHPQIADILTKQNQADKQNQAAPKIIPDKYIKYVTSVQTLDLYEALKGYYGEKQKEPLAQLETENSDQYIDRIEKRLSNWSSLDLIITGKSFLTTIVHVSSATLIPADDIGPMTLAETGCVYATVAKQDQLGNSPGSKRLFIDDRLLKRMKPLSQSLLYLHEYILAYSSIYAPAVLAGPNGTVATTGVRALVSSLIAKDISYQELQTLFASYAVEIFYKGMGLELMALPKTIVDFDLLNYQINQKLGNFHYSNWIESTVQNLKVNDLLKYLQSNGFFTSIVPVDNTLTSYDFLYNMIDEYNPQTFIAYAILKSNLTSLGNCDLQDTSAPLYDHGGYPTYPAALMSLDEMPPFIIDYNGSRKSQKATEQVRKNFCEYIKTHQQELEALIQKINADPHTDALLAFEQPVIDQLIQTQKPAWEAKKEAALNTLQEIRIPESARTALINWVNSSDPFSLSWTYTSSNTLGIQKDQIFFKE